MIEHLLFLCAFLVAALLLAVPRITSRRNVPVQLAFEEVPDGALQPAQIEHFARLDRALLELQYRPVFNIRLTNLAGANLSRFYASETDPALILTSMLRAQVPGSPGRNADYVEIITRHADGTALTTTNSGTATPFDRIPGRLRQRFPGLSPAALKERHDRKAETLLGHGPIWVRGAEILERWQASHREWCDFQVQQGLLALSATGDRLGPTRRTALRGVAQHLNPFAGGLTVTRLVAGLVVGAGLPGAGLLALRNARALEAATSLSAPALPFAAAAVLLALGGVVLGAAFRERHFVASLLFGLPSAVLLARASAAAPLVALLGLEVVARETARWLNRRRRLL